MATIANAAQIIIFVQRLQVLLEYLLAGHRIDERNLHPGKFNVGGDEIDVLGMVQDSFTGRNLLILHNTAHGRCQRERQLVRLCEAEGDGQ